MKIKFLIPVTADYSEKKQDLLDYLTPLISENTELVFQQITKGFPSVENGLQGMFNGCYVTDNVLNDKTFFDGVYVNCFDDPGVYACRETSKIPVIGPYQAALHTALTLSERVGIIATDRAGILNEERKSRQIGFSGNIAAIDCVDFKVSDIRSEKAALTQKLFDLCCDFVQNHRVTAICLGCTAMFYVVDDLRQHLQDAGIFVNIIEPVSNGVLFLENIIRLGYKNHI